MTFLFYLKIGLGESEAMWSVETVWLEMLANDFSSCYSHCLCVLFMSMVTESICKWVECQPRFLVRVGADISDGLQQHRPSFALSL